MIYILHIKQKDMELMVKTLILMFLLLLCCNSSQQKTRADEIIPSPADSVQFSNGKEAAEPVADKEITPSSADSGQPATRKDLEEIIVSDLKRSISIYEEHLVQSVPDLGRCSDLERLLILERYLDENYTYPKERIKNELKTTKSTYTTRFKRHIPDWNWSERRILDALKESLKTGAPYPTKEEEKVIIDELTIVEAEYEKKFQRLSPWWWMCTSEERLKRLKNAIETDMPYPEYYGKIEKCTVFVGSKLVVIDKYPSTYKLGKLVAYYDMLHKKLPPEWNDSSEERIKRLTTRVYNICAPYFTKEEENKLETEYIEKFGKSISNLELSMERVSFWSGQLKKGYEHPPHIIVIRTTTGATASYGDNDIAVLNMGLIGKAPLELELSIPEWLDFINAVSESVTKWKRNPLPECWPNCRQRAFSYPAPWNLFILTGDTTSDDRNRFNDDLVITTDWDMFQKIMDDMEAKIIKKGVAAR